MRHYTSQQEKSPLWIQSPEETSRVWIYGSRFSVSVPYYTQLKHTHTITHIQHKTTHSHTHEKFIHARVHTHKHTCMQTYACTLTPVIYLATSIWQAISSTKIIIPEWLYLGDSSSFTSLLYSYRLFGPISLPYPEKSVNKIATFCSSRCFQEDVFYYRKRCRIKRVPPLKRPSTLDGRAETAVLLSVRYHIEKTSL